ncbi:MAG: hypothetical protein ABI438_03770 [Dermatophilaceae bacterium]
MDANTPATPSFQGGDPTETNVAEASPIQDNPTKSYEAGADPTKSDVSKPARPKGPNAAAVVLGLFAMVLGGLIIANETMGLHVDWSRLGPGGVVAIGLVLVVLGAIGLVRRHDDA